MRPVLALLVTLLGIGLTVAAVRGAKAELDSMKFMIESGLGDKDALFEEFLLTRGALALGALMCSVTSLKLWATKAWDD